jgi:hypothetical protein
MVAVYPDPSVQSVAQMMKYEQNFATYRFIGGIHADDNLRLQSSGWCARVNTVAP